MKAAVVYNLISEVTYHHYSHVLLVTQTSTGTMWKGPTQGHEYQEAGSLRTRLEDTTQPIL